MNRLITMILALALVIGLAASPALAKGHSCSLHRDATINGSQLKARETYRMELNGNNEAHIYRGRKLVTTAAVDVRPVTDGETPNSVSLAADGTVLEVRTKKQMVVFVQKASSQPAPAATLRPILLTSVRSQR
jgi:hypothetical protein